MRVLQVLHETAHRDVFVVEKRKEQILLLVEVPIEGALAHPRLGTDVINGHGPETPFREAATGRIDEPLPPLGLRFWREAWHELDHTN